MTAIWLPTDAVPNQIPNDCDRPTELVPNEIEYDHRTYWIAYRVASRETVKITTKRWSPRSHSDGYHCQRTSHREQTRGLPGALPYQATDQDAYRMAYRRIKKLSPNGIPNWMPIHLTRGLPNDYREANGYSTEAAYRDGTENSTKNTPKLSSEWLSPRSSPPRSSPPRLYQMQNQEMARSANAMHKAAFPEQKRSSYMVSMTYRDVNVLELDQWYDMPPTPDTIGVNSATPEWSPRGLYANHRYDARSGSSHRCPKSRRDRSYDRFPYLTLGNSDDGLCLESTLRNQSRTELRVGAPMNLNSNLITIPNHDYTVTEPRWQSKINMTEKSSTEQRIFKRGR